VFFPARKEAEMHRQARSHAADVVCVVLSLAWSSPALAQKIIEFPIATSGASPHDIVTGPDGRLWFTEYYAGKLGAITTAGVITEYPLYLDTVKPYGIAAVAKDSVAAVLEADGRVVVVPVHDIPSTGVTDPIFSSPTSIVAGPDGRIWLTQAAIGAPLYALHYLGTSPSSAPFANPSSLGTLGGIAAGPDGRVWYTDRTNNKVGACPPQGGDCVDFTVPTPGSEPTRIVDGKDGALWFTETSGNKIGRVTTAGTITEFPVPTAASQPFAIAAGTDGHVWFTERTGNKIGRISPAGVITEYAIPTPGSGPECITAGPDGNIWFGEFGAGKIGRVLVRYGGDFDQSGQRNVADVFYLINFLFVNGPAPR
jgi:virginiamycin B lyase